MWYHRKHEQKHSTKILQSCLSQPCFMDVKTGHLLKNIKSTETRFLRFVAGYTLFDHKRSVDIRTELNIFNVNKKIIKYRNNWKEHLNNMEEITTPIILLNYKPKYGRRRVRRPNKRWNDQQ